MSIETEVDGDDEEVTSTDGEKKTISLSDFLRHATGSKYVRSSMRGLGFVYFLHDKPDGTRFEASTCGFQLKFPVTDRYTGNPEVFISNVFEDILNAGFKFGQI